MRRAFCRLAPLLLLGSLSLASGQALAQVEIPFYYSGASNEQLKMLCTGPWLRSSGPRIMPHNAHLYHFYSALNNIFSPQGGWRCTLSGNNFVRDTTFCLMNDPGDLRVVLNLSPSTPRSYLGVNQPALPCKKAAASAFLGDAPASGQTAEGAFRVEGAAGNTITVTLDRDPSNGSDGDIAQLRVGTQSGGTLAQKRGALPLVLQATVPSTGTLIIQAAAVPQSAAGSGVPFHGYYTLEAAGSGASEVQLEPLLTTQP